MNLPPDENLKKIIRSALRGDEGAIGTLYNLHIDKIYRYVFYRVPDEEAEDITSEVFMAMLKRLPKYQITAVPFEAWLYRIASAKIADYFRQKKGKKLISLSAITIPVNQDHEGELILQDEHKELRACFYQLNSDHQDVLFYRFVERKSHEEVALIMGKSVISIRTIQHRALKALGKLLGVDIKERHYLRGKNEE